MNKAAEQNADKAFAMSKMYFEQMNYELSTIFCLNAMTHFPKLEHIKMYTDLFEHDDIENIDQAISIISSAILRLAPEEIIEAKEIVDLLNRRRKNDTIESFASDISSKSDNDSLLNNIKYGDLSWEHINSLADEDRECALRDRLNTIKYITEYDKSEYILQEMLDTENIIEFYEHQRSFAEIFSKVKIELSATDCELHYIGARLQILNSILTQIYLLDVSRTENLANIKEVAKGYTASINELEHKFNILKSRPALRDLDRDVRQAEAEGKNYTYKISKIQEALSRCIATLSTMSCDINNIEIRSVLDKVNNIITRLAAKRFAAYQKYSADICIKAIRKEKDTTIYTSSNDAVEILQNSRMQEINESLLSHEAANFYHYAKNKLFDELDDKTKADWHVNFILSEKRELDKF